MIEHLPRAHKEIEQEFSLQDCIFQMQIRLPYPKLYSQQFQVYSINEGEYGTKPSFERETARNSI